jgi:hypothetical protein
MNLLYFGDNPDVLNPLHRQHHFKDLLNHKAVNIPAQ